MNDAPTINTDASLGSDVQSNGFQTLKERLEEIAAAVESDDISLDQVLDLYEEAVALGLQATDLLDVDITEQEETQAHILGESVQENVQESDQEQSFVTDETQDE